MPAILLEPNQIIDRQHEWRAGDSLQRFTDDFDIVVEATVRCAFGGKSAK